MLFVAILNAMLASEPLFEIFPADRSTVPYHLRDSVSLELWQKFDEKSSKIQWGFERHLRKMEWRDKQSRQLYREMNALSRKWGVPTPPDPEEPTESKFFPKKKN